MKKPLLLSTLAALLVLTLPAVASAEKGPKYSDKTGRFGIGMDRSLGGVGGLSARFQVAKNFGLQAILGFSRFSFDSKDADGTVVQTDTNTTFSAALRGDIPVVYSNKAALSIIFGVDIFNDSTAVDFNNNASANVDESNLRFAFEAGLKLEYHFTDFVSVHTEVGFIFAFINSPADAAAIGANAPVTGTPVDGEGTVMIFGRPDTFGDAGITFWFR